MRPSSTIFTLLVTPFALLLTPCALSAQTSTGNSAAVFTLPPQSRACPVRFSADRRPEGAVIWTNSTPPKRHGQGVEINFAKPERQIVSADIVVHGYPAAAMAIPAAPSRSGGVTETFHLTGSTAEPLLRSLIWTANMTVVSSVELTRVVYADGTVWQPSSRSECSASPSLYVPVGAGR